MANNHRNFVVLFLVNDSDGGIGMDKIAACTVYHDMVLIVTEQGRLFRVTLNELEDKLEIVKVSVEHKIDLR